MGGGIVNRRIGARFLRMLAVVSVVSTTGLRKHRLRAQIEAANRFRWQDAPGLCLPTSLPVAVLYGFCASDSQSGRCDCSPHLFFRERLKLGVFRCGVGLSLNRLCLTYALRPRLGISRA